MEETKKEKAVRIYRTIKRNKSILNDTTRVLTEPQRDRLTRDNALLLEVLEKISRNRTKKDPDIPDTKKRGYIPAVSAAIKKDH